MATIKEQFLNLGNSDMQTVWNELCDVFNYPDDVVYNNDEEFFQTLGGSAYDVLQKAHYGEYTFSDHFVKLNGYGNLESGNHVEDMIDVEQAVECIEDNPDHFSQWFDFDTDEDE